MDDQEVDQRQVVEPDECKTCYKLKNLAFSAKEAIEALKKEN